MTTGQPSEKAPLICRPSDGERQEEVADDERGSRNRRLRAVKAAWDPDNLLRFNKNIPPAPAG
ncbi:BBE domain-containing protein [Streptomyces europaeiscabiei]|uniref:BBE domain-containing protein n=1 Tax=Streptomyces europaeiscabiei TaxID=146819 RepID=UPI002E0D16A7|nr:BBE domain-containing protein [Streptomyces europaeiscabiei]